MDEWRWTLINKLCYSSCAPPVRKNLSLSNAQFICSFVRICILRTCLLNIFKYVLKVTMFRKSIISFKGLRIGDTGRAIFVQFICFINESFRHFPVPKKNQKHENEAKLKVTMIILENKAIYRNHLLNNREMVHSHQSSIVRLRMWNVDVVPASPVKLSTINSLYVKIHEYWRCRNYAI